ncbi:MAG: NAD-dependent malic enzyme [Deltaproteobacteria bacterium]|nr:NAD-dependent malic enzyme [Deltaproteobacteria bacterium]
MDFSFKIDPTTWQEYLSVHTKGTCLLLNPFINKGAAFTTAERRQLDLNGLLPPVVATMETQLSRSYAAFRNKQDDLEKYIYLAGLHDRNETLFFRLVHEHIEEMMPIVYTPVVGLACQRWSAIFRKPRGIYISLDHKGFIADVLRNSDVTHPSVIVVTDGERILGLGDQGAGGMGIPVGKLALYTLCAGVSPYSVIPITIDVGTDNAGLLNDPLYIGLRQRRLRGEAYQAFIDEFVEAVKEVFPDVILQWEDFLKGNAIHQLNRFKDELCTFNDDIQGTAGVVVAGLLSAMRIQDSCLTEHRVLFGGAGAAAQGIAELIANAMMAQGLTQEQARARIAMVDSQGLVLRGRPGLSDFKEDLAQPAELVAGWDVADPEHITLAEAVRGFKPTILLGTTGMPNTFTEEILVQMGKNHERPVIFPLSNPTSQAECTPTEALRATGGRALVATGSPFDPVEMDGVVHRIGQGNNAYIFPGVGLGLTVSRTRRVTNGMFLAAARALAGQLSDEDLAENALYPRLIRIREVSHAVACATIRQAVAEGHADKDQLDLLETRVERAMWYPEYLPVRFEAE